MEKIDKIIKIITKNNEASSFKKVELESDIFYGLKKIKGGFKKMVMGVGYDIGHG